MINILWWFLRFNSYLLLSRTRQTLANDLDVGGRGLLAILQDVKLNLYRKKYEPASFFFFAIKAVQLPSRQERGNGSRACRC